MEEYVEKAKRGLRESVRIVGVRERGKEIKLMGGRRKSAFDPEKLQFILPPDHRRCMGRERECSFLLDDGMRKLLGVGESPKYTPRSKSYTPVPHIQGIYNQNGNENEIQPKALFTSPRGRKRSLPPLIVHYPSPQSPSERSSNIKHRTKNSFLFKDNLHTISSPSFPDDDIIKGSLNYDASVSNNHMENSDPYSTPPSRSSGWTQPHAPNWKHHLTSTGHSYIDIPQEIQAIQGAKENIPPEIFHNEKDSEELSFGIRGVGEEREEGKRNKSLEEISLMDCSGMSQEDLMESENLINLWKTKLHILKTTYIKLQRVRLTKCYINYRIIFRRGRPTRS